MTPRPDGASVAGLLLAAGEGRRLGQPKALLRNVDGESWVHARATTLLAAGCSPVIVVVGAWAEQVAAQVPPPCVVVHAPQWVRGMGESLRVGLEAAANVDEPDAALVALVDTPGLTEQACARLVALAAPSALAQATYTGVPGHPVLLGRDHWPGVLATSTGDRGARDYLRSAAIAPRVVRVECGDVGDARDVDTVEDLPPGTRRVGG